MAETLNIYQKLAKIRKQVEVIQKNKSGFNYKYVTDDELLAKITGFMDKYGLSLIPSITQGTMQHELYHYLKTKYMIEQCQKDSVPYNKDSHIWDLKINSFYASLYDYGIYLLNALENATDYYKLLSKRYISAKYYDGVEIIKPIYKKMSLAEFERYSKNMVDKDKNLRYIPLVKYPDVNNECEIVDLISSGKNIEFYIGKSHI